ncbi:MAG: YciI family protein [Bacteroidota bacterium]
MVTDHFVLFYNTADDYLEKRQAYRSEHLGMIYEEMDAGRLLQGGAFDGAPNQAMLIFTSQEAAEAFAQKDPYVLNGVVVDWHVRVWKTVDPKA